MHYENIISKRKMYVKYICYLRNDKKNHVNNFFFPKSTTVLVNETARERKKERRSKRSFEITNHSLSPNWIIGITISLCLPCWYPAILAESVAAMLLIVLWRMPGCRFILLRTSRRARARAKGKKLAHRRGLTMAERNKK